MFRMKWVCPVASNSFPHPRGDVPTLRLRNKWMVPFSPPAWGCSDNAIPSDFAAAVFPTRVGMFRNEGGSRCGWNSFPHPRGDVPDERHEIKPLFSPLGICALKLFFSNSSSTADK